MKYSISHIDICNSQYFQGHHLPVFCIPVDSTTTLKDIKEEMLSYDSTNHIENLDNEAFKIAVEVVFDGLNLDDLFDPLLDPPELEDEDYDCYAYFTIEEEED